MKHLCNVITSDAARTHPLVTQTFSIELSIFSNLLPFLSYFKLLPVLSNRFLDAASGSTTDDCPLSKSSLTRCCAVGEDPENALSPTEDQN